jgi:hypothetical protein
MFFSWTFCSIAEDVICHLAASLELAGSIKEFKFLNH